MGTRHLSGLWNWRVVFPIHDSHGRVVAYQGRTIGAEEPRYKFTDEEDMAVDPDSLLYGIDRVPGDAVVIVEGAPSVWRLGPGTVATFGIKWKAAQAAALRQYRRRFVLFDPEPLAQRKAEELAKTLSVFGGETEVIDGFTTDPGDFTDRQAAEIMMELGFPPFVMGIGGQPCGTVRDSTPAM